MAGPDRPLMTDLKADDQPDITEIDSLCLNCYKTGNTRLMLTRIPFFREVVISSFSCPHCGFENRSLDPAASIQPEGKRFTLKVQTESDLNRRVVLPSGSNILLPQFDASFPTSDGDLSTVEGLIAGIIDKIQLLQPQRKEKQPDLATKLDGFSEKLRDILKLEQPFTMVLDDPSGNGCIENYLAPDPDPQLEVVSYKRNAEQNAALGFVSDDAAAQPDQNETPAEPINGEISKDEVLTFKLQCPECRSPCDVNMKLVDIPHFKQIVLMAAVCPQCGHRDCEVKSGGGISPKGRLYRLKLTNPNDLTRDVLVSETAAVNIPDLELESMGGTLGGKFTTLEGLILAIREQLISANPFIVGDSTPAEGKEGKMAKIIKQLEEIASGKRFNIIFELRDPAGNSYVQNYYAPDPDPEMEVIDFERTSEDNDDLGITDMNVTDYDTATGSKHHGDA
ncbi:unnamed protein product [Calicophoron daubneyi]|uniref:Zinc finger ZPR1-type domain-containing protein n=1 Tax=Calicophoron daubneyi TaxID=300641 RepID=A0AAV2TK37_CALDB